MPSWLVSARTGWPHPARPADVEVGPDATTERHGERLLRREHPQRRGRGRRAEHEGGRHVAGMVHRQCSGGPARGRRARRRRPDARRRLGPPGTSTRVAAVSATATRPRSGRVGVALPAGGDLDPGRTHPPDRRADDGPDHRHDQQEGERREEVLEASSAQQHEQRRPGEDPECERRAEVDDDVGGVGHRLPARRWRARTTLRSSCVRSRSPHRSAAAPTTPTVRARNTPEARAAALTERREGGGSPEGRRCAPPGRTAPRRPRRLARGGAGCVHATAPVILRPCAVGQLWRPPSCSWLPAGWTRSNRAPLPDGVAVASFELRREPLAGRDLRPGPRGRRHRRSPPAGPRSA